MQVPEATGIQGMAVGPGSGGLERDKDAAARDKQCGARSEWGKLPRGQGGSGLKGSVCWM